MRPRVLVVVVCKVAVKCILASVCISIHVNFLLLNANLFAMLKLVITSAQFTACVILLMNNVLCRFYTILYVLKHLLCKYMY